MNKKGFTLIELLAVIVILAIIALIATPIVLNIIKDSRESSQLRSAEFYLNAIENSIGKEMLDGTSIADGNYDIMENGNLCKEYKDNECVKKIEVDVKGTKPSSGSVTINTGKIKEIELIYPDNIVIKDEEGKIIYKKEDNVVVFDDVITFSSGDGGMYYSSVNLDRTKFKNYASYKMTIDNDKVYELVSSIGNVEVSENEYAETLILSDKAKFSYLNIASQNLSMIMLYDSSIIFDGEHHIKIEYIDNEIYPHVLRVDSGWMLILSTKLVEGDAIVEIKGSDENIVNLDVVVERENNYRIIKINNSELLSQHYQALQEGKNITVTVTQGNDNYILGGSPFIYVDDEYDCWYEDNHYYWGNNKLGFIGGC